MKNIFIILISMSLAIPAVSKAQVAYNTSPDWFSVEDSDYGTGAAFDDVNGDGFIDLAISNGNDIIQAPNYIYFNNNGILQNSAGWISDDSEYSGHCELADINSDGYPEFMVSNYISPGWDPGSVQLYMNNNGTLETSPSWITPDTIYSFRASFGDADGDGDLDLAVATGEAYYNNPQRNLIYYNVNGALQDSPGWFTDDIDAAYDVHWVDIENDGDLDLAFQTAEDYIKIYYNDNGAIETSPSWQSAVADNGNSFDFADLNGDGYVDMGVACNTQLNGSGKFKIYFSNGGVLPTTPDWESSSSGYGSEAVFTDVDNDGDYDFVGGRWWGQVYIYLNDSGNFNTSPAWESDTTYESVVENVVYADVDNGYEKQYYQVFPADGNRSLFYLGTQHIQGLDSMVVDGVNLPLADFCFSRMDGWISLANAPADKAIAYYRNSPYKDMAVSNWDTSTFLFTNTNANPPVLVNMIPENPPVNVAGGSSFQYTGVLKNNTSQNINGDVWLMLKLPGGGQYGPLQQFSGIPLSPGQTITVPNVTQFVPSYAPPGTYEYISYAGLYPSYRLDSASFAFTVNGSAGGGYDEWLLSDWFNANSQLPRDIIVAGNYPNPFNATTSISFETAIPSDVKIDIYNIAGQKVETLLDEGVAAGKHDILWDATTYASGIYFYKLTAGEKTFTRRMTLLK
ncbi:MAG: T9SS type A sorting domain-containing protein [candidate division Zixibacteria bacterium]|nr:T9SS type A sorting domain-containing protein [candidate division Zixibacteria bacterium]